MSCEFAITVASVSLLLSRYPITHSGSGVTCTSVHTDLLYINWYQFYHDEGWYKIVNCHWMKNMEPACLDTKLDIYGLIQYQSTQLNTRANPGFTFWKFGSTRVLLWVYFRLTREMLLGSIVHTYVWTRPACYLTISLPVISATCVFLKHM